jgi:EpsI family protein
MPLSVASGFAAQTTSCAGRRWPAALTIVFAMLALAIGPAGALVAARRDDAAVTVSIMPERIAGWSRELESSREWKPVFISADQELFATYRRDAAEVEWYTAVYRFQRQERKLLGYYNSIFGASEFAVPDETAVARGSHRFVPLLLQDTQGKQSLLWYAYTIGTRSWTSGPLAQVWYGVASLAGPVDSAVVAFRAKCEPDCDAARERLASFAASLCDTSRFGDCRRAP